MIVNHVNHEKALCKKYRCGQCNLSHHLLSSSQASPQHQPPQHCPQRLGSGFPTFLTQTFFNSTHQPLRLCSQFLNHPRTVFKTAFTFHISERISLDLLVVCFLLKYIDEDLIARVCANSVNNREAEFAFSEIFAEAFQGGVARC
jgi:hypothetical protein